MWTASTRWPSTISSASLVAPSVDGWRSTIAGSERSVWRSSQARISRDRQRLSWRHVRVRWSRPKTCSGRPGHPCAARSSGSRAQAEGAPSRSGAPRSQGLSTERSAVGMGASLPDWKDVESLSLPNRTAHRASGLLLAVSLAACPGARVQGPPRPAPAAAPAVQPAAGKASFFFPVAVPLAEVGRLVEASVPPRMSDERKAEIASALKEGFYRYTLERGAVEVGFVGGELTFAFPVHGSLTIGGRLAGLPVQETVDFGGRVHGTASPAIGPDWRPDPKPAARVELDRADLNVPGVFPVSVRSFPEERLN